MRYGRLVLGAVFLFAVSGVHAQTYYTATDGGAGPGGPFTNSNAEAAIFDAAASLLGSESLITLESAPVGSFTNLAIAPGVTVNGTDVSGNPLYISNVPNDLGDPALDGFNTTPGGANYIEQMGGVATFSFATPITAFGAYFSGVQSEFFTDTITFSDGSSQSVTIPDVDAVDGGVSFAGFTDTNGSISSVTITAGSAGPGGFGDFIGIDDVRIVSQQAPNGTPEPSSLAFLATSVLVGGGFMRRRKRAATV